MSAYFEWMTHFGRAGIVTISLVGTLVLGVLPIWSLIDCTQDKIRPSRSKMAWISFIALCFVAGPMVYGLFASTSRYLKVIVGASMTGVLLVVAMYFTFLGPATKLPEKQTFTVTVEPPKPQAKPTVKAKPEREVASPHRPKGPRKARPRARQPKTP